MRTRENWFSAYPTFGIRIDVTHYERAPLFGVGFELDGCPRERTSGVDRSFREAQSVDANVERRELNDRRALRIVGVYFLLLAAYIGYESGADLILKRAPEHSLPGIVLACFSLILMPALSRAKQKVGRELNSPAMQADAKQTNFCVYLSAILIGGLVLNALFNFWWADPAAALLMVPLIAKEGIEALRGEKCIDCHGAQG